MFTFPFDDLLCDLAGRFPPNACWAVSCGSALTLHGIDYTPNDLDFFAPCEGAYQMLDELKGLEVIFPFQRSASRIFDSYWGRFRANGIEVDLVGDFSVKRKRDVFVWNAEHPCWDHLKVTTVRSQAVPVFSLEDLLLIYWALPDEKIKVDKIVNALKIYGCDYSYLRELVGQMSSFWADFDSLIDG